MKLLIAGSRGITAFDLTPYITEDVDTIISGGAKGVDALAEQYADSHHLSKYILQPEYKRFGRGAPLKRNEEMIGMADSVLVIWDGESKGAHYTIEYTKKLGKPITVVKVDVDR